MRINPDTLTGTWSYPTEIRFGPGRIAELPDACAAAGIASPLFVTDPGLQDLPMTQAAMASLRAAGLRAGCFADVRPNPLAANVVAGVEAYRAGGHDGVVGFGGGSAIDVAKAIALMAGQTRPLADFEDIGDNWRRADATAIAPVVAVPTTAGTGSEVGRASVIADAPGGRKRIVFHPRMMPRIVVADPELTVGLPPDLTAATGMDALTHCLEAFLAPAFHPIADGVALGGLRLAVEWLPRACADGGDIRARAHMMAAASMGAALLSMGTKGKRFCLPNSQVMLHQPLIGGVMQGPATDLGIEAKHMLRLRDRLYKMLADATGKDVQTIHRDFDRNKWLFAEEAVEYGCADRVLDRAPEGVPARRSPDVDADDDKE